jgi:hypothetical protein
LGFNFGVTMIEQMEAQARHQLAASIAAKPKASVVALHKGHAIEIHLRVLGTSKELFGYSYDGIRLERSVLLQLLCTETACPQCQRTRANWNAFRGISCVTRRVAQSGYQFRHLVEEVSIEAAGRSCVARPAAFQCRISCPAKAHAASVVRRTGWDLFEEGRYVAGGLTTNPKTLEQEPALPTIDVATAWLAARSPNLK